RTTAGATQDVEPVMDGPRILEYQQLVQRIAIAPHIQDYAVRLVLATHPKGQDDAGGLGEGGGDATPMVHKYVRFGASLRAAQALVLGATCRAMLEAGGAGRVAVGIEDVREVSLPALRHRIILNFEAEAEGLSADGVVRNIIETL